VCSENHLNSKQQIRNQFIYKVLFSNQSRVEYRGCMPVAEEGDIFDTTRQSFKSFSVLHLDFEFMSCRLIARLASQFCCLCAAQFSLPSHQNCFCI